MHFSRANLDVQQIRENPRSNENTPPSSGKMQSEAVLEAAETLITMQQTRDPNQCSSHQLTQKENIRSAFTEKINIIENIKLN